MSIRIVGAGMAGLLAAQMMRRRSPVVLERQPCLPNNHSAVLRFRTDVVGQVLGVPFRRVRVIKSVLPWRNPAADALAYSMKVSGQYRTDRSILPGTEVVDRYVAPPNLVERMAEGVDVRYGQDVVDLGDERVVSTIPMPEMMALLDYSPRPEFGHFSGMNVRALVDDCDAYLSMYVPAPSLPFSRLSITGRELIIELSREFSTGYLPDRMMHDLVDQAAHLLGLSKMQVGHVEVHRQHYAKIAPIDEGERRRFIIWANNIRGAAYSLGRYATWRPGLLMDDLVNDVRQIERMMDDPSGYEAHMREYRR